MKKIVFLWILLLMAGCRPDGHPDPFHVQVWCGGSFTQQKEQEQGPFTLQVDVAAHAQVKNLVVKVAMPKNVEIEKYLLKTTQGTKTLSSEWRRPDDRHNVIWHGEIHPRASWMQRLINSYPRLRKSVAIFARAPQSSLPVGEKVRVQVSLDYYDDPYAGDDYVPYGSYSESFEIGPECGGQKHVPQVR